MPGVLFFTINTIMWNKIKNLLNRIFGAAPVTEKKSTKTKTITKKRTNETAIPMVKQLKRKK